MTYNIILTTSHNAGVWVFEEDVLIFVSEEERFSRVKGDPVSISALMFVIQNVLKNIESSIINLYEYNTKKQKQHIITYSASRVNCEDISIYEILLFKFGAKRNNINYKFIHDDHHKYHAVGARIKSKFENSINIVIDGSGSYLNNNNAQKHNLQQDSFQESFSVYYHNNKMSQCLLKEYSNTSNHTMQFEKMFMENGTRYRLTNVISLGGLYDKMSSIIFSEKTQDMFDIARKKPNHSGKLMGLAPFGLISTVETFDDNTVDNMVNHIIGRASVDDINVKNVAYTTQKYFEHRLVRYIDEAIKLYPNCKNITISGGCVMNITANYMLLGRYPDYKFYFDPIGYDFGIPYGIAVEKFGAKHDFNTLYLGYNHDTSNFKIYNKTHEQVIESLLNKEVVAIYQGRSEVGQRALGNRSLLLDPRLEDGKDRMNIIKKREKFRPFACICLEEDVDEWFDTRGYPLYHMMTAVNVKKEKRKLIPSVVHIDGTCRAQSINDTQNPVIYKLLKMWKEKTGIPMLMNTSFNLAGEPIVETPEDAVRTFKNSDIHQLWIV